MCDHIYGVPCVPIMHYRILLYMGTCPVTFGTVTLLLCRNTHRTTNVLHCVLLFHSLLKFCLLSGHSVVCTYLTDKICTIYTIPLTLFTLKCYSMRLYPYYVTRVWLDNIRHGRCHQACRTCSGLSIYIGRWYCSPLPTAGWITTPFIRKSPTYPSTPGWWHPGLGEPYRPTFADRKAIIDLPTVNTGENRLCMTPLPLLCLSLDQASFSFFFSFFFCFLSFFLFDRPARFR